MPGCQLSDWSTFLKVEDKESITKIVGQHYGRLAYMSALVYVPCSQMAFQLRVDSPSVSMWLLEREHPSPSSSMENWGWVCQSLSLYIHSSFSRKKNTKKEPRCWTGLNKQILTAGVCPGQGCLRHHEYHRRTKKQGPVPYPMVREDFTESTLLNSS